MEYGPGQFDKQGQYFWSLVKQAGWNRERVSMLLLKSYSTSHWNALSAPDKRAVIATMKRYAEANRDKKMRQLRQRIMATAAKCGHSKDLVHSNLEMWGYSPSLRELNIIQLMDVYKSYKKIGRKEK